MGEKEKRGENRPKERRKMGEKERKKRRASTKENVC